MKAYSLKITLPKFAYFINLEILPVTTKIRENRSEPKQEDPEVIYRRLKAKEQSIREMNRIQAMFLAQTRF